MDTANRIALAGQIRRGLETLVRENGIGTPADVAAILIMAAAESEAYAVTVLRVTPEQHAAAKRVSANDRVIEHEKIAAAKKHGDDFKNQMLANQGNGS